MVEWKQARDDTPEYLCQFAHLELHREADGSWSLSLASYIFFLQLRGKWQTHVKAHQKAYATKWNSKPLTTKA